MQVAPEVGGRVLEIPVVEGDRVEEGRSDRALDTRDVDLALRRAQAERAQPPTRSCGCCRPARGRKTSARREAQATAAAGDVAGGQAELAAAEADLQRFETAAAEQLRLAEAARRCGDATRCGARSRGVGAGARRRGARRRGAAAAPARAAKRSTAARARVAAVDAQIASLEKNKADATVLAPIDGIVSERLLDPGEMAAPRAPIVVLTDLDHAWAEVFVDEPQVPRLKLGQPATVFTDAGGTPSRQRSASSRRRPSSRRATCRRPKTARSSSTA